MPQFRRLIEQEEREMAHLELRYELRREIIRLLFAYEQRNIPFALNYSDDYPVEFVFFTLSTWDRQVTPDLLRMASDDG